MDIFKDNIFFKEKEFESPDEPGSGQKMDVEFIKWLTVIRGYVKRPFKINSGFRTKEHNDSLSKSSPVSSHKYGKAADIGCPDDVFRCEVISRALQFGITRIGVYRTFIHLDNDKTKRQCVIWYG